MAIETNVDTLDEAATRTLHLDAIKALPWMHEMIQTNGMHTAPICRVPGHPNHTHDHVKNKSRFIVEGEQTWRFADELEAHPVLPDEFIFAAASAMSHVEVAGDKPSIRTAVRAIGEFHRYDRPDTTHMEKK